VGVLVSIIASLKDIIELWRSGKTAYGELSKRKPKQIYDAASFLALTDPENQGTIRHVDTRKRFFEFKVYVDCVTFESRPFKGELNVLEFRFSKPERKDVLENPRNQDSGFFGRRLRAKAMMLREDDLISIKGYFRKYKHSELLWITDIQRD
jgi:hypothetical protein